MTSTRGAACTRIKIYVSATDKQLSDLLQLIKAHAVVLCEPLLVATDGADGPPSIPFRRVTFATPTYLLLSTSQITDWLLSLSLFGGWVGTEDFMQ